MTLPDGTARKKIPQIVVALVPSPWCAAVKFGTHSQQMARVIGTVVLSFQQ